MSVMRVDAFQPNALLKGRTQRNTVRHIDHKHAAQPLFAHDLHREMVMRITHLLRAVSLQPVTTIVVALNYGLTHA